MPNRVLDLVIARIRPIWKDALPVLLALRDRRTPTQAKIIALLALAYALLPLDLLPDATPFLGVADDILVVPTLLALAARTLPTPVLQDARSRTLNVQRRLPWLIPGVIAAILTGLTLFSWLIWRALHG